MIGSLSARFAVVWVKWRSSLVLALRSLWLHKLRSFLSVLGIIIGTAAVIALMALRQRQHGGRPGRHQPPGDDQHHRPQRQADRRSRLGTNARSWIATYGLT